MAHQRGRDDADRCFVCGPDNPIGLGIQFRIEDEVCRGQFTPDANHSGFDGITHGGILFSVLDDVMANWLFLRGIRAYTAKSQVRFHRPLPIGARARLEARCRKRKRNLVVMEGRILGADGEKPFAECEATYMVEE